MKGQLGIHVVPVQAGEQQMGRENDLPHPLTAKASEVAERLLEGSASVVHLWKQVVVDVAVTRDRVLPCTIIVPIAREPPFREPR
jgi:hypothetical protein